MDKLQFQPITNVDPGLDRPEKKPKPKVPRCRDCRYVPKPPSSPNLAALTAKARAGFALSPDGEENGDLEEDTSSLEEEMSLILTL